MGIFSSALFFHSLIRWGILFTVAVAGFAALIGYLRRGPIPNWHRTIAILAMVLCHAQLVVGGILYGFRMPAFKYMAADQARFWKFEHVGMMVLAIGLVTAGRLLSQRAHTEQGKHLRVAIFYLLALAIFIATIPWPNTPMGAGRGWL